MKRGTGIFLVYTQNSPDFENTYCFTDPKAKLQQPELLGFSLGPTPPWAAAEEARRGAPSRESGPPQPPAAPPQPACHCACLIRACQTHGIGPRLSFRESPAASPRLTLQAPVQAADSGHAAVAPESMLSCFRVPRRLSLTVVCLLPNDHCTTGQE